MKIENRMIEFRFGNRRPDSNRIYELGEAESGRVPSGNASVMAVWYVNSSEDIFEGVCTLEKHSEKFFDGVCMLEKYPRVKRSNVKTD